MREYSAGTNFPGPADLGVQQMDVTRRQSGLRRQAAVVVDGSHSRQTTFTTNRLQQFQFLLLRAILPFQPRRNDGPATRFQNPLNLLKESGLVRDMGEAFDRQHTVK